jgi:quercetin dioxygenase-like cupin family protein
LTLCPALGFPTLATAAMLNRVLAPREDPGFWLGWALLITGLVSAALLYLVAADRGRLRPGVASGVAYGALCWLVAGAVLMPLFGLAVPSAAPTTPAPLSPPDPMRGSFMMLHLGIAAPIAALVAWLMFGAVVGATAGSRSSDPSVRRLVPSWNGRPTEPPAVRTVALGAAISIAALFTIGLVVARLDIPPTGSSVTAARTLATGPVEALPEGDSFFSVVELPQASGATLGAHAHVAGFAYSLDGVATLTFHDGRTIRVGPGEAGFMAAQAVHSHVNADDRVPAAALALLIVALAGVVCLIAFRPGHRDGRLLPVALVLLIAAGALGTWNPWSNDWFFISVRPVAARGAPMPLPTASRVYESPDLGALPPGPYEETLEEITVAPNEEAADVGSAGAALLLVLDGLVEVQPADGSSIQLGARGATLLQPGAAVRVVNAGDRPAHLLRFAVTPAPPG